MKNWRYILKTYILSTCCSFAVVVAANAFLAAEEYAMTIGVYEIRQAFWICCITCLVIEVLMMFSYPKAWISHMVSLIGLFGSVFGFGSFVFKVIPLYPSVYISVSIMILAIYLLCYLLSSAIQKNTAEEINKKLSRRVTKLQEDFKNEDY